MWCLPDPVDYWQIAVLILRHLRRRALCSNPDGVGVIPIHDEFVPYLLCETGGSSFVAPLLINDFPVRDGIAEALLRLLVELLIDLLIDSSGPVPLLLQMEILKIK